MKRLFRICVDDFCCPYKYKKAVNSFYFCKEDANSENTSNHLEYKIEKLINKVDQISGKLLDSQKFIDKIEDTKILINDVVNRAIERIDDDQLVLEAIDSAVVRIERDQITLNKNFSKLSDQIDQIQFFISSRLDEIIAEIQKITKKTEELVIDFE